MVRELIAVVQRERAVMGVFLSLEDPTKGIRSEAASAGFYESPMKTKHARIQLLTIEDLLNGKAIDIPRWHEQRTFKKAPRRASARTPQPKLPFED